MKKLILIASVFLAVALAAPQAEAQKGAAGGKPDKADRKISQQAESRLETRDVMKERAYKERGDKERDDAEDALEYERERAEERREAAEEYAERNQVAGKEGERLKDQENAAGRGNETSQEMRARRDERKAIKEEYRAEREAGVDADVDEEAVADEQKKKAKKPWYKFWGD